MGKSLKDILIKEEVNAVKRSGNGTHNVLTPGEYDMKVEGFIEEENYSYITVMHGTNKYNFFYNLFNKEGKLDATTLAWIKGLATCAVTENTSLLDIANSAVGVTYKIKIYNYTAKSGKNAGQVQHAIDFNTLPIMQINDVSSEDIDITEDVPF